jgi:hypothetical protein
VEVLVTDTVHLPFAGLDLEVRMQDPFQQVNETMTQNLKIDAIEKMIDAAEQKASADEQRFLDLMHANNFTYRLSETEHAQDFAFGTRKTFEVNTYIVELKAGAELEKYNALTEGSSGFTGTPKGTRFGDPSTQAPRLMSKLFVRAKQEADALAMVTGGHLGKVISAQEMPKSEGSIMEMLFKLDKGGKEEMMLNEGSTHTSTMAIRFELLD